MSISFYQGNLNYQKVMDLLSYFDSSFTPNLSKQVNLKEYAIKISERASFLIMSEGKNTVGWVVYYVNTSSVFITSFGLHQKFRHRNFGSIMMEMFLKTETVNHSKSINLEVHSENLKAISFYKKFNFEFESQTDNKLYGVRYS